MKKYINIWSKFWFQEKPVEGIAIFRILFGSVCLTTFIQDSLSMNFFWGPNAIQSVATGMKNFTFPVLNIFQFFTITESLLYLIVFIHFFSLLCFTLGFKTRIFTVVSFILMVSFHQRNINMTNSADVLMRIYMFLMIFSPAGNKYSIDAVFAKRKNIALKTFHSAWVHRLIQIQIAVVYLSTVIAKLKGNTWIDGSAVYYASRLVDLTRFSVPFLLDWKWSIMLMTWGTLIIEFLLGTLIFYKPFKVPLIVIGIFFHLGIEYMMTIPTFEWLMIVSLIAMFNFEDYPKIDKIVWNKIKKRALRDG